MGTYLCVYMCVSVCVCMCVLEFAGSTHIPDEDRISAAKAKRERLRGISEGGYIPLSKLRGTSSIHTLQAVGTHPPE